MGVKAVDQTEMGRQLGRLPGQIVLGAAAENQHIDLTFVRQQNIHGMHRRTCIQGLELGRVATGVNPLELHIGVLGDSSFHAAAQIAVTDDSNADRGWGRCHDEQFLQTKQNFNYCPLMHQLGAGTAAISVRCV